jgi:peptidoglycan/LPS O-acetylase OafA/YrhL
MTHAYPADIRPLTGLRFIAAFWLLLYFFWERLGVPREAAPGFIIKGHLGVDLFFVLSGFVLAHVYGPQIAAGRFSYGGFVWARLARVYPLHLACLLATIVLWSAGRAMGVDFPAGAFELAHLPAHLTLTHAWGILKSDGWNFPSWSISAEWFAYLTFPVAFAVAAWFRKVPWAGVLAAGALFGVLFTLVAQVGMTLTNMTWQGGALRIVPSFLVGIALWRLGDAHVSVRGPWAIAGVAGSAFWIVVAAQAGLSDAIIWPALAALVFFTAETAKSTKTAMFATPAWVYLGEVSFALYMVHLPVDIAFYQIVERVLPGAQGGMLVVLMIAAIGASLAAAMIAHAFVEKPAREWMRAHPPGLARGAPAK